MFRTVYRLPFRLLGIPVQLDITFLLVLPLLAWIIGSELGNYIRLFNLPVDPEPLEEGLMPYFLGLLAAVGLFTSVVLHELGHAAVGQSYGVEIRSITLWILGGMAQFERIPRQPGAEAVIAIAGPLTSYAVGAVCWVVLAFTSDLAPPVAFILGYLMWMNWFLATFNLLPALPLDGGRILRSLLALRMSHLRATRVAAGASKVQALALGLLGFLSLNVFLVLIAFFVYIAGTGESQVTTVAEMLHGIKVHDLMTREVKTVSPHTRVSELMQRMFHERHLGYPVVDSSRNMIGLVTLDDVKRLRGDSGSSDADTSIEKIMSREVLTIPYDASALEAFERMAQNDFGKLIVVDAYGRMVGIISKTDLMRAIQVRMVGLPLGQRV